jgi:hypothetical protein
VIPQVSGVPQYYTPGTPFSFTIYVPETLNDFTSFHLVLDLFTSPSQTDLTLTAAPPSSQYVFPSTNTFQPGPGTPPTLSPLTIQDTYIPSVTIVPGTNDTIAVVTVNPGLTLTGTIDIHFDSSSILSYINPNSDGIPPDQLPPDSFVAQNPNPPPPAVPTPAAWLSFTIGGVILLGRNRLLRGRANATQVA